MLKVYKYFGLLTCSVLCSHVGSASSRNRDPYHDFSFRLADEARRARGILEFMKGAQQNQYNDQRAYLLLIVSLWEAVRYVYEDVLSRSYDLPLGNEEDPSWHSSLVAIGNLIKLSAANETASGAIVDAGWKLDGLLEKIVLQRSNAPDRLIPSILLFVLGAKLNDKTTALLRKRTDAASQDILKAYDKLATILAPLGDAPVHYRSEESFYFERPYSDLISHGGFPDGDFHREEMNGDRPRSHGEGPRHKSRPRDDDSHNKSHQLQSSQDEDMQYSRENDGRIANAHDDNRTSREDSRNNSSNGRKDTRQGTRNNDRQERKADDRQDPRDDPRDSRKDNRQNSGDDRAPRNDDRRKAGQREDNRDSRAANPQRSTEREEERRSGSTRKTQTRRDDAAQRDQDDRRGSRGQSSKLSDLVGDSSRGETSRSGSTRSRLSDVNMTVDGNHFPIERRLRIVVDGEEIPVEQSLTVITK